MSAICAGWGYLMLGIFNFIRDNRGVVDRAVGHDVAISDTCPNSFAIILLTVPKYYSRNPEKRLYSLNVEASCNSGSGQRLD